MGEGKLTKAQAERLWLLKDWRSGGWRINLRGALKWERAVSVLVTQGLLERGGEGLGAMYRITEAGRQALSEGEKS